MKAIILAFLLGCAGQPAIPAADHPVEDMIAHTVLLSSPGCTGVRIGGGLVVTAAHCTDEKKLGDAYGDYVLKYQDATHDFSVLSGDNLILPVWLKDARTGEHVYVIGYPGSIDDDKQYLTVTDGVYTGVEYNSMQRLTAHAWYGNSGGGAWNDQGALVGILVEIRMTGEGTPWPAHSYMVPIRYVRALVL